MCLLAPRSRLTPVQMPVPVPRHSKPVAHPVVKNSHRNLGQTLQTPLLPAFLSGPPQEPPPSSAQEEWLRSLPSWRRSDQRLSVDEVHPPVQPHHQQDFYLGLAAAGNAPVIKGAHAEACIPPMQSFFGHDPAPIKLVHPNGQYAAPQAIDMEMDLDNSSCARAPIHPGQGHDILIGQDALAAAGSDMHRASSGSGGTPPVGILTDSVTLCNRSYLSSPIYDDQSPGSASGPDSGSSPLEPLTPFGDFVDRAIAESQHAVLEDHYVDHSALADDYQEKQIVPEVYQAAPVFPTIAEAPKQQDPVSDTLTPGSSGWYKKLAEPLSEWVANYVWKVCTTGFSLPPAFVQPSYVFHAFLSFSEVEFPSFFSINAGPYAVAAPSYLAPAVHSLLLSTLLQPSAVFLSIWYIVRLPVYFGSAPLAPEFIKENAFRAALLDADAGLERDTVEASAAFRLVVLGCMLANKWLDDHTFSNKTWYVHYLSRLSTETNLILLSGTRFQTSLCRLSTNWNPSLLISSVTTCRFLLSSGPNGFPISSPTISLYLRRLTCSRFPGHPPILIQLSGGQSRTYSRAPTATLRPWCLSPSSSVWKTDCEKGRKRNRLWNSRLILMKTAP